MPSVPPITEDDIAEYLLQTPEFFERHAEVLGTVQLRSPHGGRAISLQERQAQMLRDKIRVLEHRMVELLQHGNENMVIADRMVRWARQLLLAPDAAELPQQMVQELRTRFDVPQAGVRLWGLREEHVQAPFAATDEPQLLAFARSLSEPYCGVNDRFDAAQWLDQPDAAASVALLPLRERGTVFGLLVLASPDAARFQATMGTDFLVRIAELASAALWRLCDPERLPGLQP